MIGNLSQVYYGYKVESKIGEDLETDALSPTSQNCYYVEMRRSWENTLQGSNSNER